MPVVLSGGGAVSTPVSLGTVTLFDYEVQPDTTPLVNGEVFIWLGQDRATTAAPATVLESKRQRVVTDANGYWTVNVVPNLLIVPAGTYYVVRTPFRTYRVAIPTGAGPFQASANPAP